MEEASVDRLMVQTGIVEDALKGVNQDAEIHGAVNPG